MKKNILIFLSIFTVSCSQYNSDFESKVSKPYVSVNADSFTSEERFFKEGSSFSVLCANDIEEFNEILREELIVGIERILLEKNMEKSSSFNETDFILVFQAYVDPLFESNFYMRSLFVNIYEASHKKLLWMGEFFSIGYRNSIHEIYPFLLKSFSEVSFKTESLERSYECEI